MKINIEIDSELLKARTDRQVKNLAYSTAQAVNDTALQVQYRIQGDVQERFHLRKKQGAKSWEGATSPYQDETGDAPARGERSWLVRQVKMFAWANVRRGRLYAEVGVAQRPRLLLAGFETGMMREPFKGKHVAVPVSATARDGSIDRPVDPALTFRKLAFRVRWTKSGKRQIKGKMRTFILGATATHPMGGVYMRVGPGREDIRMAYSFKRAWRLRKVLQFVARGKQVYEKSFRENFMRRFYKLDR
jgi:hypothetical protein